MRALFLVCLLALAGCSTDYVIPDPPKFTPIVCSPIPYPEPLVLQPLEDIENKVTHWTISHEDFARVVSWMHEIERFSEDLGKTFDYLETCIDTYNREQERRFETPPPDT